MHKQIIITIFSLLLLFNQSSKLKTEYKEYVSSLCRISETYYYEARLDDAIDLLEKNLAFLKDKEIDLNDKARLQFQLGKMIYYKQTLTAKDFDNAINYISEVQKVIEQTNDKSLIADNIDLLGLAIFFKAFSDGNFDVALKHFQNAYELRKQINDRRGISESLFHIGIIYENKNNSNAEDKKRAKEFFQQSLKLAEEGNYKLEMSYPYRHLAGLNQEQGNFDLALELFNKSYNLREEIGFLIYLPPSSIAIGDLYFEKKQFDKALENYKKAFQLSKEIKAHTFTISSSLLIGDVHKELNDSKAALQFYNEALEIAKALNYNSEIKQSEEKIKSLSAK